MAVYTLFSQTGGAVLQADPTAYTIGVQFSVSSAANLTAIWFYSPSGAVVLPQQIALYTTDGVNHDLEAASWSGTFGTGWVRAPLATPFVLTPGTQYKAAVVQTTLANWYSATGAYWTSGAGSGGITNGPLTAPNNAGATPGQDSFSTSTPSYPGLTFNGNNYWVDPEVTTASAAVSGVVQFLTPPRKRRDIRAYWRRLDAPFPGLGTPVTGGLVIPRRRDARRGGLWEKVYGTVSLVPPPPPPPEQGVLITPGPVSTGWIAGPVSTGWITGPVSAS